jgi:hypothetical protein
MSVRAAVKLYPFRRFNRWIRSVLFYGHWMIGLVDQPVGSALGWSSLPSSVRWIEPFNKKRYLADPFPWPGSADTIVCESFDLATRVGSLVALKLNENGIAD